MRHAVIMAGGAGTRLWPLSRQATPKQFQKLVGDQTLLQQTFNRIARILPADRIWVLTGELHRQLVADQLPAITPSRIITEPIGRNTAAATLLAALTILDEDPNATLFGLLPADHYIGKEKIFADVTEHAFNFLENRPEFVTTIGIRPTEPNTGYGYVETGQTLVEDQAYPVLAVKSFREKPDIKTAEAFITTGRYLWNGGYFLFNGQKMIEYYQTLAPEIYRTVTAFRQNPSTERYQAIPSQSIDKAIAEKIDHLAILPVEMEWSDIGNWATLHDILAAQRQDGQVMMGEHIGQGGRNNLIMAGDKLVATIGLENIVIVDTPGALLVCEKGSVQEVKKIVEQLQEQGKHHLL